jgi:uncharacterized protein DUF6851/vanadium-dependent haloperoxidase-like protein
MYGLFTRRARAAALIAAGAALLGPPGASADVPAGNIVVAWNGLLLQAVRETNPGPPVVARALAVIHTCMYDAWAAYDARAEGTMFASRLRRPQAEHTDFNKRAAITQAAVLAAGDLFPTERARFEQFAQQLGIDSRDTRSMPAQVARAACGAVLAARHSDGSNQLGDLHPGAYSDYTGYQPVNAPDQVVDPNHWQPLSVPNGGGFITQRFLLPHWGNVRPFALNEVRRIKIKAPAPYGSKAYLEQIREVVSYSASLTDVQKCIAEYWADGPRSETPPGHWNLLAQFVSGRDHHNLDEDVKMFFALNNAVMDAGIWTWYVKRQYDYVRPITAIRYVLAGQMIQAWNGPNNGTGSMRGEDWNPYQLSTSPTPPFAEYVSGHSTFSASAARILERYTGSDVLGYSAQIPAGSLRIEAGVPAAAVTLSYATFSDAADEAGLSRRYGGIHFRDADLEGRRVGKIIAEMVWDKAQRLFDPRPDKGEEQQAEH